MVLVAVLLAVRHRGGAPVHGRPPEEVRATLSSFFAAGSVVSLLGLWAVGEVPTSTWPLTVV